MLEPGVRVAQAMRFQPTRAPLRIDLTLDQAAAFEHLQVTR